jgi:DMSO/TMAO reductase YedYZ molybdopterin-dependent catalytic subunit
LNGDKPELSDPKPARLKRLLTRRTFLTAAGGAAGVIIIAENWPRLSDAAGYQPLLDVGDRFGMKIQRLAMRGIRLAPEYRVDQLSPNHPSTGGFGSSYIDADPAYDQMVAERFRNWRLRIHGLVERPTSFSLADIRQMPTRTQITMHSCDQGWSAIGQWTGVPLRWLLTRVGLMSRAKYVVFHAMDKIGGINLFDSIDLFDAFHPQTILAHMFNGSELPVGHGAPLRLRVELQIGYKNLKHLESVEIVDSLERIGGGRGGFFQGYGYQWYAGQ